MKQIIAVLFSWLLVSSAMSQHTVKTFKITKDWQVTNNTAFELIANNQSFRVDTWENDFVRIEFILKTDKSDYTNDDYENDLNINAKKSNSKLVINTNYSIENSQSLWDWLFKSKSKNEDYTTGNIIYLPKSISSLNFNTNYCNLGIGGAFNFNIPIHLKTNYGFVSMVLCNGITSINSNYTDIELIDMRNVKLNATYANLSLHGIDTLSVNSSYCDIKTSRTPYIGTMNSKYDDIKIISAGFLNLTSSYSNIILSEIWKGLKANLVYSDLKIKNISKSASELSINCVYSDCKIKINPENPINLVVNDVNGDINIKNSPLVITKKQETSKTTLLHAKTKSATESSPIIKINSKNSDLIFN
jgi:hypothetical protein